MTVAVAVVCFICAWVLYLWLRFLFIRVRMHRAVGRVCRRYGWIFGRSKRGVYLIEKDEDLFKAAVVGAVFRRSRLVFSDRGSYRFEYSFSIPLRFEQSATFTHDGETRSIPDTDLILICPVCREIVLREGHLHETLLGDGDAVGGARVYSLAGILKLLDRK